MTNSNFVRAAWLSPTGRVLAGSVVLLYLAILCSGGPAIQAAETAAAPATGKLAGVAGGTGAPSVVSLDGVWLLATDPRNIGRGEKWWQKPVAEAKSTRVPWIIQEAFPGYHGVAWYWRDFFAPAQSRPAGRYLLRFWAVDYMGEVWLNGESLGKHESGETPFILDVTDVIKAGATNHLCVRVLNPKLEPIDGMTMGQTPHQARVIPYSAGAAYNCGGITDSVELMLTPAVRIEDLYASPDLKSGTIRVEANLRNAGAKTVHQRLEFGVAPAASGERLNTVILERDLPPGDTRVTAEFKLPQPRLWDLADPFLYRVSLRTENGQVGSLDECSVRCGFRDFRFENGYFRLNGRRIFLRSSHTCNHFPVGQRLPLDPDQARRDLLDVKVMGFNTIRFIWGGATRYQLDLCDEIGLMVYEESIASSSMSESGYYLASAGAIVAVDPAVHPNEELRSIMGQRFDRSVSELIRRDRNHPSIIIWGLLNEAGNTPSFRHAVGMLPLVRSLDTTRMVFLNAGRFDGLAPGGNDAFAKVKLWHSPHAREPWVVLNPLAEPIETPFGFAWPPQRVCLHPGEKGEYSVARWTAPISGRCEVKATFTGLPKMSATTDEHVLHRGQSLFKKAINIAGQPNTASFSGPIQVNKGDTVDFVVGFGNASYGSDSTCLDATLRYESGENFDLAKNFGKSANPQAPWSYGYLKPGPKPDASTFTLYTEGGSTAIIGSIANPGSTRWEDLLVDMHNYPRVPHTAGIVHSLRTMSGPTPIFLSEYGIGSAVDLWRTTRHFERLGQAEAEDARFYRDKLDRYLADWKRWKLDELYARPEDFFTESLRKMAGQRTLGMNAIRANTNVIGYSLTGMNDHVSCGEGLTTTFRELKPGTVDAMFEGFAPLRWCLFAEPVNIYRGGKVHIEAILANEDALSPGKYPAVVQVVGPNNLRVFQQSITVTIPERSSGPESPLAFRVLEKELTIDAPAGKYRLLATLEKGGAPTGGETEFYVDDPAQMPPTAGEVVLWGEDPALAKWLGEHQIKSRPFAADELKSREVILVGSRAPTPAAPAFVSLAQHMTRGSTAIFLVPSVFKEGDNPVRWLPLAKKGSLGSIYGWLYLKDEWAKRHPIFEGLPANGLMDYTFYREIIPDALWMNQEPLGQAVAGAIKASQDYASGLMVSVHPFGQGRFILNTLLIRENLGTHPAAERLLRNLLRFAAAESAQPLADLPADFEGTLKSIAYR